MTDIQLYVYDDPGILYLESARAVILFAKEAVQEREIFTVALAGGKTSGPLYRLLAGELASQMPWDKTLLFWGDERMVAPDHPDSNYGMASRELLQHVPIPDENVFRIRGESTSAADAAAEYEERVRKAFSTFEVDRLELALLGIGTDGHTASIFPGDEDKNPDLWIAPAQAPPSSPVRERVTMTLPFLNRSRHAVFLATGDQKKDPVRSTISRNNASLYPAVRIEPTHQLLVYADRAASP